MAGSSAGRTRSRWRSCSSWRARAGLIPWRNSCSQTTRTIATASDCASRRRLEGRGCSRTWTSPTEARSSSTGAPIRGAVTGRASARTVRTGVNWPTTHTDGRRDLAGRANDPLGTQHGANMEIVLVELEDGVTVPFTWHLRIFSGEERLPEHDRYWSRKRQRWGSLRRAACDCRLSVSRALAPPLPTRAIRKRPGKVPGIARRGRRTRRQARGPGRGCARAPADFVPRFGRQGAPGRRHRALKERA